MDKTLQEYHLLVVSDLHLSEGRDRFNKKFSKNEDFFFDEEFARFLAYYQDRRRLGGAKWHLIINGDLFDFLQVIQVDGSTSGASPGSETSGPGLPCGERETILKLRKIADGHWLFFESLAGFVGAGNLLTIIKGNHDVELHYPGVRTAFLVELLAAFENRVQRDPDWGTDKDPGAIDGDSVLFSEWYYFEPDLLWVEHGNRYEGFNSFKYWLSPLLPKIDGWPERRKDEIDLPFGSLFVRYLFNHVERVDPFADNIKPSSRFVWWLIRKHPIAALQFIFSDGRKMMDRVQRAWAPVAPDAWEERRRQHNASLVELASESGIGLPRLEALDRLRAPSLLKEPGFWGKVLRFFLRKWIVLPAVTLAVVAIVLSVLFAAAYLLGNMIPVVVREKIIDPFVKFVSPVAHWAVLIVAFAGLCLLLRWLFKEQEKQKPSYLKKRSERIVDPELSGVRYVIMGHTHNPELYGLGEGDDREKEYFNTGTWTTVFSEQERLIRKPVELVFVQGLRTSGGLILKLYEWDDGAGEPRLLKLFRDE